jgi:PPOX class probable F420-dependent enzyme
MSEGKAKRNTMAQDPGFQTLRGYKYCQLTTFRRSGVAVNTPVWFGLNGTTLYVRTETPSGKIKRIRNNPRVQVAPCSALGRIRGAATAARARILPPDAEALAERVLRRHYGLGRRLFYLLIEPVLRLRGIGEAYLEIVPASEIASPQCDAPPLELEGRR